MSIDLVLIDSVVELSPRDTTTRVRYLRASSEQRSTEAATQTQTQTDTTASEVDEIPMTPIAVDREKKWVSVALRSVRTADWIIFFALLIFFVLCFKKCLLLRNK